MKLEGGVGEGRGRGSFMRNSVILSEGVAAGNDRSGTWWVELSVCLNID